jgi:tetratricopeptide (TPR) repeat protein
MRTLVRTLALIVVAAAAIVAAGPVQAQSKPGAKKPPTPTKFTPPTKAQSAMQVAGIAERVVDNLWTQTDHYWHEGDYNRIVDLCRIVAEAEPSFNEAYANAAWLLWSMGDTPGADLFLQHGIARSDNKGDVLFDFGQHLYNTKRYAQAEPYLRRSITYPRPTYMAYSTLGHTYRQLGQLDKSIAVWEQAVKKFPEMGAAKTNLDRVKQLKKASVN